MPFFTRKNKEKDVCILSSEAGASAPGACFVEAVDYSFGVAGGFQKIKGLRVEVEKVVYLPSLDAPPDRPHPFVYFIAIINDSSRSVIIQGRKWVIKSGSGETTIVEGQGVVGETPRLSPGERFSYNSYHVTKEDSDVSGSYFGVDDQGKGIVVSVPSFSLKIPSGA